jgi:integrase
MGHAARGFGAMKLPKYVHGFIDRHGRARFYFRRAGFKKVALRGLPWSPEFMTAYERAREGQPAQIGAANVLPGSMRALAVSYYGSPEYQRMSSKSVRRNIIEKFLRETDANGVCNGDKRAAMLRREHVIGVMAERADKPESANGLRKALRALMQHAVAIKLRGDDPTQGVRSIPPKARGGFHTWTEEEIAQFEAHHPIGSKPRLALALGLYSGQARQDVVAMGPQHIRQEVLHWVRKKTAHSTALNLFIPVLPQLRAILDCTPSGHLTFLVTEFGKPFAVAGFGNWFREQCNKAGLRRCSFHGLRKAAARRLAEHGCTPHEIAAITGHATLKEIERYTKDAERRHLAESAMEKLKTATKSG